ncbi:MAG: thioredoxin family protein [Thermodesulfobacteriota bacterium]
MAEIERISVKGHPVGVQGLRQVIEEMAGEYYGRPDREIAEEMVKRLGNKNYIPAAAREDSGRALVREFRKYLGPPFSEARAGPLEIRVLGQGCPRCNLLEKEVMEVLAELGLAADLQHVTDLAEIGRSGAMGMPALMINGRMVSVGGVPSRSKIRGWLLEMKD